MRKTSVATLAACACLAVAPLWAPAWGQAPSGSNQNQSVHHWNTKAFQAHPPGNTNAFSSHPANRANTNAFASSPSAHANTNALGTKNGGEVTAFGSGKGATTNAFGNRGTATNNERRLAGSFGTGNDQRASPVGPRRNPNGPAKGGSS